jgi:hypothetical protein
MAVDLFNQYYSNPKKQFVYTNMTCSSASSADNTNFIINNTEGQISNGTDILSSLSLSSIKESVTEWSNQTKTIEPYSILYLQGLDFGLTFMQRGYGQIDASLINTNLWEYFVRLDASFGYLEGGASKTLSISIKADYENHINIIDALNNSFALTNAPFTVELKDSSVLLFTSSISGLEFSALTDVSLSTIENDVSNPYSPFEATSYVLNQIDSYYVPAKKYPNGAYKVLLITADYPKYNASSIDESELSLQIAHIKDKVDLYEKDTSTNQYNKLTKYVVDSYFNQDEFSYFAWANPNNNTDVSAISDASTNYIGLYGYINWIESNELWKKFGSLYAIISAGDDLGSSHLNLISSPIIYNPNSFPIRLNILGGC